MKQEGSSNILEGMPTLLGQFPFPSFYSNWPKKKNLPPLPNDTPFTELESTGKVDDKFQLRVQKKITKCIHTEKKHYAKNMCYTCYYQNNKQDKVIKCGHTDRIVFARNMCCSCYSMAYKAYKKRKLNQEP